MKQRTRVLLGAMLALALVTGIILATREGGADGHTPASSATELATAKASAQAAASVWGEAEHEVWASALAPSVTLAGRYRLDYAHTMRMLEGGQHAGLPADSQMSVKAELELARAPDPDGADGWLVGRILDVVVSGDERLLARAGLPASTPAEHLEAPFMVRFDETGAATERRYREVMPSGARNVVGSLLTGLQVVVPEGTTVVDGRWEVTEEGLDGPVAARYGVKSGGLTKTWHREIGASGWTLDEPGRLVSDGAVEWSLTGSGDTPRLSRATLQVGLAGDVSMTEALALKFSSDTSATLVRVGEGVALWASELERAALVGQDGAAAVEAKASVAEPLPVPSGRSPPSPRSARRACLCPSSSAPTSRSSGASTPRARTRASSAARRASPSSASRVSTSPSPSATRSPRTGRTSCSGSVATSTRTTTATTRPTSATPTSATTSAAPTAGAMAS